MNVQVVYCNHQTAEIGLRERIAFPSADHIVRAYDELRTRFPRSEYVVISTCNRIELYTAQEDPGDAPTHADIAQFFSDFHQVPKVEFLNDLLECRGPDAVRHLFEVVSSIDSMVLGESQIVQQIKSAYDLAMQTDANGPLTNALFQRALTVSARVRTETKLTEGRVSIASVAIGDFGKSIFDRFEDKTVVVLGAGEMAAETLTYLRGEGVKRIIVCNRSFERGVRLAQELAGEAKPWDELQHWLGQADVLVSATGATQPILNRRDFAAIRKQTGPKPLFILDLGAPRDIEPDVSDLDDGIFLYDIDDLEATCERNRKKRTSEIAKAQAIVEEETQKFMHEIYHKATGPIIKRLREHWHQISRQELELLYRKCPELDDRQREAMEKTIHRVVNKLLHPPLETLRDEARTGPPTSMLDTLKQLFHIRD